RATTRPGRPTDPWRQVAVLEGTPSSLEGEGRPTSSKRSLVASRPPALAGPRHPHVRSRKVTGVTVVGVRGPLVAVEAHVGRGLPSPPDRAAQHSGLAGGRGHAGAGSPAYTIPARSGSSSSDRRRQATF